jgi:hypothetical protein
MLDQTYLDEMITDKKVVEEIQLLATRYNNVLKGPSTLKEEQIIQLVQIVDDLMKLFELPTPNTPNKYDNTKVGTTPTLLKCHFYGEYPTIFDAKRSKKEEWNISTNTSFDIFGEDNGNKEVVRLFNAFVIGKDYTAWNKQVNTADLYNKFVKPEKKQEREKKKQLLNTVKHPKSHRTEYALEVIKATVEDLEYVIKETGRRSVAISEELTREMLWNMFSDVQTLPEQSPPSTPADQSTKPSGDGTNPKVENPGGVSPPPLEIGKPEVERGDSTTGSKFSAARAALDFMDSHRLSTSAKRPILPPSKPRRVSSSKRPDSPQRIDLSIYLRPDPASE